MNSSVKLSKRVSCLPGRAARPQRTVSARAGADRPMWLTGSKAPAHLNGSMPGDYGFDPLGLGVDAGKLKWYQEAELMNGRFAMIGAAGILGAEILGVNTTDLTWYEAGTKEYEIPLAPLVAIQAVVMGFLEMKRYQGWKEYGVTGLGNDFPFDPAGLAKKDADTMKLKEVKNGRLAMVSCFGFAAQMAATGVGPVQNLTDHLKNPAANNIIGSVLTIQDHLPDPGFAQVS
ncbi:light-harvesting protein of photosystem I [Chloropicon primus]|uniref:Chlorophyll a-b binding protein, chloroplastic n=1 Tax=Chloropicon primus TaxID=1764295 RepID=A0A5B8MJG1_9CHLO|nr:light-harvesting protein of photosystem I [Chloropicon primus]UPQ99960.1 light-harvesting protein of photosystem I [Chloropicon primus]|eukprot:QDZ20748.1 light-harvesting protein of photosystem I [Chloropicon primus]